MCGVLGRAPVSVSTSDHDRAFSEKFSSTLSLHTLNASGSVDTIGANCRRQMRNILQSKIMSAAKS